MIETIREETMTTGKLLRRVLLTATLTSAPLLSPDNAVAESRKGGIDRPGTRTSQHKVLKEVPREELKKASSESSGVSPIHQVQYQPNNTASGSPPVQNQAVLNELNRLFKESGKEMPPMNMYSAPQSNRQAGSGVVNQSAVQQPRVAQQPAQDAAAHVTVANPASQQAMRPAVGRTTASSATAPPRKNLFQKFVSKLKGEPATAVAPAVPRGSAASGLSTFSAPPPTGTPSVGAAPANSVTASRPQVRGQAAGVNSQGQISGQAARHVSQPVPSSNAAAKTGGGNRPMDGQPRYVQPGTAPSYVQGLVPAPAPSQSASAAVPPAVPPGADSAVGRARYANNAAPIQPALVAPAAEGFELPFAEPVASSDGDELLDLDSLIEIPESRIVNTASGGVGRNEVSSGSGNHVEQQVVEVRTQTTVRGTQQQAAQASVQSAEAAVENPFTGVKLAVSDEEYFQDITGRASLDALPDLDSADENESFVASEPLPPIEDFDVELPGLPLPEVDDADEVEVANRLITRGISERTVSGVEPGHVNAEAARTQQPVQQQNSVRMAAVPSGGLKSVESEKTSMSLEQARRENQRLQILARTGQTGFKGFCPVMLRDQRELVDAMPGIVSSFGLQQYSFCSERAKAAFEADPSRYAPAAGGSDVVLLVNTAEEQAGMLDYSLWYRDRLYLFCSRETMALFSKEPSRFANQY